MLKRTPATTSLVADNTLRNLKFFGINFVAIYAKVFKVGLISSRFPTVFNGTAKNCSPDDG